MENVVQLPTKISLRLQDIVRAGGKGVVASWLSSHPGARAKFRIRVKRLGDTPRASWTKKQFRYLDDGIWELKWENNKKEFRVLGFDHKGSFVMVGGCTHKQGVYDPPGWLDTAKRRKGEVERGEWRTIDFEP